jgi:dihydrofolate reductase/catechol 2,3-dioxygenase-like lactoylglutathione lyase family enzyme
MEGPTMGVVEVDISMSVDGFITGPNEHGARLGEGGELLHAWFQQDPDGPRLLDDALFTSAGAVITSRKVYDGTDGWGEDGFYQMPVFVLTHRPHDMVVKGRTVFTFVTDGIEQAVALARAAAGEKKVHIMGGASVIQQALDAGLVDSVHLHVAPIIIGTGTRLFDNLTDRIELERTEVVESQFATHLRFQVIHTPRPARAAAGEGLAQSRLADSGLRDGRVATRLPAQDLDRARRFYAEKLGLQPDEERPGGLRYQCREGWFALFESSGRPSGEHTQIAFEVEDLEQTVRELRARGVVFEEYDSPGLQTSEGIASVEGNYPSARAIGERAAWFRDSEGNLLAVGQPIR